jgi:hypothetical protein
VETVLGNGACIWEARFIIANCMESRRVVQLGSGFGMRLKKGSGARSI